MDLHLVRKWPDTSTSCLLLAYVPSVVTTLKHVKSLEEKLCGQFRDSDAEKREDTVIPWNEEQVLTYYSL